MDTLIKNASVVTTSGVFPANLGISGDTISYIGGDSPAAETTIDAGGCYLLPGGIDVHTHLDAPSSGMRTADDWYSGTVAAACGGTTTIIDFCSQTRGDTLTSALAEWDQRSQGKAVIDYGYHMIVIDLTETVAEELERLPDLGVTTFKLFMAYPGTSMVDDDTMVHVLDSARRNGAMVMVHAENGAAATHLQQHYLAQGLTAPKYHAASRPPRIEAEATARALALAETVGAPVYIVHLTNAASLDELVRAKLRGVNAYAETCTQYLYLTADDLDRPGFEGAKFVFTPPARTIADQNILWTALANGLLETVSSDHGGTTTAQKEMGRNDFTLIPNGAPGIEERMMLAYQGVNTGRITLPQFVHLTATRPAQLFGLAPKKGALQVGADADVLIWDPEKPFVIRNADLHHQVDYSCYEGMSGTGAPRMVLSRGEVLVENGNFVGTRGRGRFIPRAKLFGRR